MRYFFYIFLIFLFSSCHFYNFEETFDVELPPVEGVNLKNFSYFWILEYCREDGKPETQTFNRDTRKIPVTVKKGYVQAYSISAVIQVDAAKQFKTMPAGFIYPFHVDKDGKFGFVWESGFKSSLLIKLSRFMNPESINLNRLFNVIDVKSIDDNNWMIDRDLILRQLLTGSFSVYDIRVLRERTIYLSLMSGTWENANILGEDILSLSSDSDTEISLYTGSSRYIHTSGLILEIEVQSDGEFEYIIY